MFSSHFPVLCLAAFSLVSTAAAHEPYTGSTDPLYRRDGTQWIDMPADPLAYQGCCTGSDCNAVPGEIVSKGFERTADGGWHVEMSLQDTQRINTQSKHALNAYIDPHRVMPSFDGQFHICIWETIRNAPSQGVICFWAPPDV